mmetsp:Transcript_64384/g.152319  ORF Transcript_64384/g.152319 Transcript_64384/m.152319 type:complete len:128 (+) Transcript_64384:36-419(+)
MARKPVTKFQQAVYDATSSVPRGRVTTYKTIAQAVAEHMGQNPCPQAVGQALRRNPFAPVVPCHRVVSSDLALHGFSGSTDCAQLDRKRKLLEDEGVILGKGGNVAPECVVQELTVPQNKKSNKKPR